VVVAMHGLVYGLGLDIALACDVRYAAADATFSIKVCLALLLLFLPRYMSDSLLSACSRWMLGSRLTLARSHASGTRSLPALHTSSRTRRARSTQPKQHASGSCRVWCRDHSRKSVVRRSRLPTKSLRRVPLRSLRRRSCFFTRETIGVPGRIFGVAIRAEVFVGPA
jgi:hypothetical protein